MKFEYLVSNSSIQRVRVSVSSSLHENEISKDESPNYSSLIENFVEKNVKEKEEEKTKESFDHRPLLNLINELNQSEHIQPNKNIPSLSSSKILPAKQISPFKPIILHKKYQVEFCLY